MYSFRTISTTSVNNGNSGGEGWWSKLLHVRKIEPGKDSHSKLLSDTERVYELQSMFFPSICFLILVLIILLYHFSNSKTLFQYHTIFCLLAVINVHHTYYT